MELTFLGQSCLRLRGREAEVVIDPPAQRRGGSRLSPDIVVSTEGSAEPDQLRPHDGGPQLVSGPGEYELRGVRITGIPVGELTVMRVEVDDVRVVALGRLARPLGEDAVERLGHVDVLAVPVGGGDALGATEATQLVNDLEPAVVVPVRYRSDLTEGEYESVDRFAKEMGLAEGWEAQPKLNLTGSSGSVEQTRVVILEPRA